MQIQKKTIIKRSYMKNEAQVFLVLAQLKMRAKDTQIGRACEQVLLWLLLLFFFFILLYSSGIALYVIHTTLTAAAVLL